MKATLLAACLSLLSATCAAQGRGAAAQEKSGRVNDEKLISCVKSGDADCVARRLAAGADANASDEKGVAALSLAAEGKSARVVRLLLDAGADVNGARQGEAAPLCRAALFGRKEIAETLLDRGAKVKVTCGAEHGESPLMDALRGAMYGDMPAELKEGLVDADGGDAGGENDAAAAAAAAARDNAEKVREALNTLPGEFLAVARLLLARGADVNVVAQCEVGETALMYAAGGANVEMVRELLARGADVNKGAQVLMLLQESEREHRRAKRSALPTLSREQAAMLAWGEKTAPAREEIRRLLKAAGAKEAVREDAGPDDDEASAEEAAGETFTDIIRKNDMKDFARVVEAYAAHPLGARVLPDALRTSIIFTRTEMVKLLLERGVDPNIRSREGGGGTPLLQAAQDGNLEYVRMLLEAGADVNATFSDGGTALDAAEGRASSEEHRAVAELLKAHGAKSKRQK